MSEFEITNKTLENFWKEYVEFCTEKEQELSPVSAHKLFLKTKSEERNTTVDEINALYQKANNFCSPKLTAEKIREYSEEIRSKFR